MLQYVMAHLGVNFTDDDIIEMIIEVPYLLNIRGNRRIEMGTLKKYSETTYLPYFCQSASLSFKK